VIEDLKAPKGKFRIVGIDKFEIPGEGHWVEGDYDSLDEALRIARNNTREASGDATDSSMATVFYVYDENGSYLGGDTYKGE
jgi:hypothetical protein